MVSNAEESEQRDKKRTPTWIDLYATLIFYDFVGIFNTKVIEILD